MTTSHRVTILATDYQASLDWLMDHGHAVSHEKYDELYQALGEWHVPPDSQIRVTLTFESVDPSLVMLFKLRWAVK